MNTLYQGLDTWQKPAQIVLAALLYYLAAQIGFFFAIPPGFASAVWPGAGIALALLLHFGPHTILGIFISSTLANAYAGGLTPHTVSDWLLPTFIALGSCLQGLLAAFLIKRFCHWPAPFGTRNDTLRFFILSGPVACLVASTIGVTGLILFVDLPSNLWFFSWFTWWIGDSLGICFFTPIALFLLNPHEGIKRWFVVALSAGIFILISALFAYSRQSFLIRVETETQKKADYLMLELEMLRHSMDRKLRAVSAHFYTSDYVSEREFLNFSQIMFRDEKQQNRLMWLPYQFNKKLKSSYAKVYEYPVGPSWLAIDELPNFEFMAESSLEGSIAMAPLSLSMFGDEKVLLLMHPILNLKGTDKKYNEINVPEKKERLLGYIITLSRIKDWSENWKNRAKKLDLDIAITDVTDEINVGLYSSFMSDPKELSVSRKFQYFNRDWKVTVSPHDVLSAYGKDWTTWLFMVVGTLVGCFIQIFLLILTSFNFMLQKAVEEKTNVLASTNRQLVKASKAKSQFLANMSHEVRTPLNAITGFCDRLGKMDLPINAQPYLRKIDSSSQLLLQIVNDILDYSRLESGKMPLDIQNVVLRDITDSMQDMFADIANDKGIEFVSSVDNDIAEVIKTDGLRLRQILMNLCSNAMKFTEYGKVTMQVMLPQFDQLHIKVTDTGIGIKKENLRTIFSTFHQADASTTRQYGGTGLGLSISQRLVHLLGGHIEVTSAEGQGSCFTVVLPYEEGDLETVNLSVPCQYEKLAGKTIMVVEDNVLNQEIAKELLLDWDCNVVIADNGKEALELLGQMKQVDAILMDCQMPIMDGYEATKKIRKSKLYGHLPVIAMTANVLPEDVERCRLSGMDAHVSKPMSETHLCRTLIDVMNL